MLDSACIMCETTWLPGVYKRQHNKVIFFFSFCTPYVFFSYTSVKRILQQNKEFEVMQAFGLQEVGRILANFKGISQDSCFVWITDSKDFRSATKEEPHNSRK